MASKVSMVRGWVKEAVDALSLKGCKIKVVEGIVKDDSGELFGSCDYTTDQTEAIITFNGRTHGSEMEIKDLIKNLGGKFQIR